MKSAVRVSLGIGLEVRPISANVVFTLAPRSFEPAGASLSPEEAKF